MAVWAFYLLLLRKYPWTWEKRITVWNVHSIRRRSKGPEIDNPPLFSSIPHQSGRSL